MRFGTITKTCRNWQIGKRVVVNCVAPDGDVYASRGIERRWVSAGDITIDPDPAPDPVSDITTFGLSCPACGAETRVIDSRSHKYGIRRRRECMANKAHRFSTHETMDKAPRYVPPPKTPPRHRRAPRPSGDGGFPMMSVSGHTVAIVFVERAREWAAYSADDGWVEVPASAAKKPFAIWRQETTEDDPVFDPRPVPSKKKWTGLGQNRADRITFDKKRRR